MVLDWSRSWTLWSLWVPSNVGHSMGLWNQHPEIMILKRRLLYSCVWNSLFLTSGWDADLRHCGGDQKHSVRRRILFFYLEINSYEQSLLTVTLLVYFHSRSLLSLEIIFTFFHIVLIYFLLLWIMYYRAEKTSKVNWREEKNPHNLARIHALVFWFQDQFQTNISFFHINAEKWIYYVLYFRHCIMPWFTRALFHFHITAAI